MTATSRRQSKPTLMDKMMAEPIRLPGAPQIVVTRGWAYQWLKSLGYPLQGGYGSVDYMVFGRDIHTRERDTLTLSDMTAPDVLSLIAFMERDMRQEDAR